LGRPSGRPFSFDQGNLLSAVPKGLSGAEQGITETFTLAIDQVFSTKSQGAGILYCRGNEISYKNCFDSRRRGPDTCHPVE
jgi:hypothetical protein